MCRYVAGSKAIVSAISPNDQLMAIISRDGLLRFWAMQTRELIRITKATVLQFTGVSLTCSHAVLPVLPIPWKAGTSSDPLHLRHVQLDAGGADMGTRQHTHSHGDNRQPQVCACAHRQEPGHHAAGVCSSPVFCPCKLSSPHHLA